MKSIFRRVKNSYRAGTPAAKTVRSNAVPSVPTVVPVSCTVLMTPMKQSVSRQVRWTIPASYDQLHISGYAVRSPGFKSIATSTAVSMKSRIMKTSYADYGRRIVKKSGSVTRPDKFSILIEALCGYSRCTVVRSRMTHWWSSVHCETIDRRYNR